MSQHDLDRTQAIERAQLRSFERSIAGVEWLLLVLVVLHVFVTRPAAIRDFALVAVLVAFAASLLALRVVPSLRARPRRKLAIEIVIMIGFLTIVLHELGETSGGLLNLYLLPIIAAALVLGRNGAIWATLLVCGSYFGLALSAAGSDGLTAVLFTEAATVLAPFLLVAFLTSILADDIEASKRALQTMSDRDPLTSLLNIGAFMRVAERMHRKIDQEGTPYSILVVDIDHLKHINETYGHAAGNKAIDTVGRALLRVTRTGDIAARIGGEEFVAFLPKCDIAEATELAQRLKSLVYAATFEVNVDIVRVQVSVGIASFPIDGDALQRVMSAADRAMYKDKQLRTRPEGQLVIQKR